MENPYYRGEDTEDEDENDRNRSNRLMLSTLSTQAGATAQTNGGIKKVKKSKRTSNSQVPDCFKPETLHMHVGKGGDGFEAWKGNKKVIKKQKIGVQRIEIKAIPREGQFSAPYQSATKFSFNKGS